MRIAALVSRIIRQFIRDKRTLGMMIVAPILVLSLISVVFSSNEEKPQIGIINGPDFIQEAFEEAEIPVTQFESNQLAIESVNKGIIDGILEINKEEMAITVEGSDPTKNKMVLASVMTVLQQLRTGLVPMEPTIIYLYGSEDLDTFDYIGPFLIGFFAFFFVFLIAGVSFLRERTTGTLERLLSTPLKRWEIVTGYVLGFGIFTIFQSIIIVWYSIAVLNIMMVGSIFYVLLLTCLLSMSALTLGTLLSAFAKNELQMIQFIPLVVVPQVFFSGLFSIESMAPWLQSLSIFMPLTYGGTAMREVMIRGGGFASIATEVLVLFGFSCFFMVLNTLALKKYRRL